MEFNLLQYVFIFLMFACLTYLATPIFRLVAIKMKIFDKPGGRKLQKYAVPYLGGLAIIIPLVLAAVVFNFTYLPDFDQSELIIGFLLPAVVIGAVGLFDDIYQLPAFPRFISQSIVGLFTSYLLYVNNSGIQIFNNSILNSLTTSLWIIGIINALNFIDNMDGLAVGVSLIAALGFFVISFSNGQYLVALLSAAITGSCLGFLFWNKNPARIYMGDSGALFLGFMLSAISIRIDLKEANYIQIVLVPLLVLAIPFIDTTQVIISRISRRVSPFTGGQDHISHRLLQLGFDEKKAVYLIWLGSLVFTIMAIFISGVLN
jgi:UDP-GlcNAc:undecaprenyl-phosphate GlcNAc-1-phosphate transferase